MSIVDEKPFWDSLSWVRRTILKKIPNIEDAEEVCQDVYLRIWNYYHKWDRGKGTFEAWVRTILKNKICDYYRRIDKQNKREERLLIIPKVNFSPPEILELQECRQQLYKAIEAISNQHYQQALYLLLDGYTYPEIAHILGCSEQAAKNWVFRGKKKLRIILKRRDTF